MSGWTVELDTQGYDTSSSTRVHPELSIMNGDPATKISFRYNNTEPRA